MIARSIPASADASSRLTILPILAEGRRGHTMNLKTLFGKLIRDEQGGEVLEYALIAGLIVVAAIAVIGAVGTKVVATWTSLNSSM
jgi:Flp pilus assembly pilin Flp